MRVVFLITLLYVGGAVAAKVNYYARFEDGRRLKHAAKSAEITEKQIEMVVGGMKAWSDSKYTASKLKKKDVVQVINVEPAESKSEAVDTVKDMQDIVNKHLTSLDIA